MNILALGHELGGRTLMVSASPWPMIGVQFDREYGRDLVVSLGFITVSLWWWKGALLRPLPDDGQTEQHDEQRAGDDT